MNSWLSGDERTTGRTRGVRPVNVEVRGVEPRSAESFTPASPSAAISKRSVVGTLTASFPTSYPQLIFGTRSRTSGAAAYEATPAFRRGRHPPGGRAVTEGYSGSQCHLWFGISCWLPGYLRGPGVLGSLPSLQHSTSKPVHPHECALMVTPVEKFSSRNRNTRCLGWT